ncbi:hypothetical protein LCGC14_2933650, partial [marine sediment metagenome]
AKRGAGGYNSVTWRESQLLTCATNTLQAQERKVFCNAPEALYILAGLKAQICPSRQYHKSRKATGITSENLFKKFPDFEGALLVWFDKGIRPHLFTPEQLNQICTVVPIVEALQQAKRSGIGASTFQAPTTGGFQPFGTPRRF